MRIHIIVLVACFALFARAHSQPTTSNASIQAMHAAIQATDISQANSLEGRSFDVSVPGTASDKTLRVTAEGQPAGVPFHVDRTGPDTFKVTIADAAKLVTDGPLLPRFRRLTFEIVSSQVIDFETAIVGDGTCVYRMRFKQRGGGPIDLSAIQGAYEVSWKLSTNAVTAALDGADLTLTRPQNSQVQTTLTLTLKARDNEETLSTGAINVPSCDNGAPPETQIVYRETERLASQCLIDVDPQLDVSCDVCGPLTANFSPTYRNTCARQVTCDTYVALFKRQGTSWSRAAEQTGWVRVNPNQEYQYSTSTRADAYYSRFMAKGVKLSNCRYTDVQ